MTFIQNNDEATNTLISLKGEPIPRPANPIKSGCWFGGWYTDPEYTAAFDFATIITEDIILYAKWVVPDAVLPASLTKIDFEAFAGSAFTCVKLSDKTTSIGSRAFAECLNLKYIYIPATIKTIAADAFAGVEHLTILGTSDSYAETYAIAYAIAYGYTFVAIS